MGAIEQTRLRDLQQKNKLLFFIFSISLLAGTIQYFLAQDISKAMLFVAEWFILGSSYFTLQRIVKKESLFPYMFLAVIYAFTLSFIFLYGGSLQTAFVIILVVLFSAIHLNTIIFSIGYGAGLLAFVLNYLHAESQKGLFSEAFGTMMLVYLLVGAVLFVFIHLNKGQFQQLQHMLIQTAEEQEKKQQQQVWNR